MKVLSIQGGPRRKGNTATLLKSYLEGVKSSGNHSIKEFILEGMDIKPCRACESCRKETGRFCIISDDMHKIYPEFLDADVIVLSTPVYWWSISAQLKLFIDRLYGLNFESHPERYKGKKLVLVLTYGDEDPNSGAELVIGMFKEIASYTGMKIENIIRYSSGEKHVSEDHSKLSEAFEQGRMLGVM